MKNLDYDILNEFLRYVIVGGTAFIIDFSTLYILTEFLHLHYLFSAVIGFIVGTIVNYNMSKKWAFKNTLEANFKAFLIFTLVGIAGLGLTEFGMWVGVDKLDINYKITKIIVAAIVLIWNFILRKLLVFNNELTNMRL